MNQVIALVFLGSEGPGPAEQWVQRGREAALRDLVRALRGLPGVDRCIVATSERAAAERHPDLPVEWDFDAPAQVFHFGRRLAGLLGIDDHQ